MITRITIDTVENTFCNATDNSWLYEMLLDRRMLHFEPKYTIPDSFYESMRMDMHLRLMFDIEQHMRKLLDEIT